MPDWEAIRAEYLAGGISLRALANRHGLSADALMKRAQRQDWGELRRQTVRKASARTTTKVAEVVSNAAERAVRRHLRLLETVFADYERLRGGTTDAKDFRSLVAALCEAIKTERTALKLDRDDDEQGSTLADLLTLVEARAVQAGGSHAG